MSYGNSGKAVRRILEATQDVLPAGNMLAANFETFKLTGGIKREQAGNVRPDRQPVDNPATDIEVTGSATADFIHGDYDPEFAMAFANPMAAAQSVTGTTISAVAAGNIIRHGTTGSWVNFVDGDLVYITGFTTNGAAWLGRVNGTPAGTDLVIDVLFKTLVNEAVGPSVTVMHAGRFRLGTSILTHHYEQWHALQVKGFEFGGVGVSQYMLDATLPTRIKQSWQLRGLSRTRLTAQLANATTAANGYPAVGSTSNFGDALNPTFGFGIRYNGVLLSNIRMKSLKLTLDNPLLAEGALGNLGPIDLSLDNLFTVKVDASFLIIGANSETLITDSDNPDAEKSFGFGYKDAQGHRGYFWLPAVQPADGSDSGLQQSGSDEYSLSLVGKYSAVGGMFQYTKF